MADDKKKPEEGKPKSKKPVRYVPSEEVSVVSEHEAEGLSYVLQEIKALREEIVRIGSLLPDASASGETPVPGGPGAEQE